MKHVVAYRRAEKTWRPECMDCDWKGPFVPAHRKAEEIAAEHVRKSLGAWSPAR